MALLCFNYLPSLSSSSSCSSRIQPSPLPSPVCRLHVGLKDIAGNRAPLGANFSTGRVRTVKVIVKSAASDVDGVGSETNEEPKPVVPVEELPLESKERQKMEQRMKMKMAKKIRLRRKRLLRKRAMRKKGRWPPSKMKKLKNV